MRGLGVWDLRCTGSRYEGLGVWSGRGLSCAGVWRAIVEGRRTGQSPETHGQQALWKEISGGQEAGAEWA